jgi:hypothetical protein
MSPVAGLRFRDPACLRCVGSVTARSSSGGLQRLLGRELRPLCACCSSATSPPRVAASAAKEPSRSPAADGCSWAIPAVTAMAPIACSRASPRRASKCPRRLLRRCLRASAAQNTSSRFGERTREPTARSALTARSKAPTATWGGALSPGPRRRVRGACSWTAHPLRRDPILAGGALELSL